MVEAVNLSTIDARPQANALTAIIIMPSSESCHTGRFTDSTEHSCWSRGLWQVMTESLLHNTPSVIQQALQTENSVVALMFSS
jgi:hypothetical protein